MSSQPKLPTRLNPKQLFFDTVCLNRLRLCSSQLLHPKVNLQIVHTQSCQAKFDSILLDIKGGFLQRQIMYALEERNGNEKGRMEGGN